MAENNSASAWQTMKTLWQTNRLLSASFLLVVLITLLIAIETAAGFFHWRAAPDEPIKRWMTIRYISNSYRVDPRLVHDAIGLPPGEPVRAPLGKIIREYELDRNATIDRILAAIKADRAKNDGKRPKRREPPPPKDQKTEGEEG